MVGNVVSHLALLNCKVGNVVLHLALLNCNVGYVVLHLPPCRTNLIPLRLLPFQNKLVRQVPPPFFGSAMMCHITSLCYATIYTWLEFNIEVSKYLNIEDSIENT